MSDIFDEVDEEVRREQLKKLWDRYGTLVIALTIVVVLCVAAWQGYDYWQNKKAGELGAQFVAASLLAEQGKHEEAAKAFAAITETGTPGYRVLAGLREASELGERDPKAAVAAFDAVASNSATPQPLKDFAALRAAMLLADTAPFAEVAGRLEPLAAAGAPFRHTARELLAFAAWKANDLAAVQKWTKLIVDDPETPPSLRQRVEVLTQLAAAGGHG